MGSGKVWKCKRCRYKVETSGLWEFYRDTEGQRKRHGHPEPVSKEAAERGIKGFSYFAYCPNCDEVRDVIAYEFETPRDYFGAWGGLHGNHDQELSCPECGGKLYVSLLDLKCPRCRRGFFCAIVSWIS